MSCKLTLRCGRGECSFELDDFHSTFKICFGHSEQGLHLRVYVFSIVVNILQFCCNCFAVNDFLTMNNVLGQDTVIIFSTCVNWATSCSIYCVQIVYRLLRTAIVMSNWAGGVCIRLVQNHTELSGGVCT